MTFRKIEQQYLVKDYMQTGVKTIVSSTPLKTAVSVMVSEKTNGLVVVNSDKKVVGILSSWDIIQHVVPDYLEHEHEQLASFEAGEVFAQRVLEVQNDPVDRFMTKKVRCVSPQDTLMEVTAMLSQFHIRQLPVVDERQCLVGYINRTDIKKAIADILNIKYNK